MLSTDKVQHIASLAKLNITDDEASHYASELNKVVGYIDELERVDVEGVSATAQVTGLSDVLRDDEVRVWDESERQAALAQADLDEQGRLRVKKIL